MSKIFVFGGSGFLGKHLIKKLDRNFDFSYLVHNSNDTATNSIKGDILKPASYESNLKNSDVVINLVGQVEPNLEQLITNNIAGSLNLLQSSVKNNIKKIILISTINVYGENKNLPSKETDDLSPITNYGMIKMLNEKLYENFSKLHDIDVTILRLSGIYGPGKIKGFFPQLLNSISDENIILRPYNNGNQFRDFLYVDDAIDGIIKSINNKSSGFDIFNISSGLKYSIKEIISIVEKLSNSKISVEYVNEKFDEECIWADNLKAKQILDFIPKISIEDGIKKTLNLT